MHRPIAAEQSKCSGCCVSHVQPVRAYAVRISEAKGAESRDAGKLLVHGRKSGGPALCSATLLSLRTVLPAFALRPSSRCRCLICFDGGINCPVGSPRS